MQEKGYVEFLALKSLKTVRLGALLFRRSENLFPVFVEKCTLHSF